MRRKKYGPSNRERRYDRFGRNMGAKSVTLEISARFARYHTLARLNQKEVDQSLIDCAFENYAETIYGTIGEPKQGLITG